MSPNTAEVCGGHQAQPSTEHMVLVQRINFFKSNCLVFDLYQLGPSFHKNIRRTTLFYITYCTVKVKNFMNIFSRIYETLCGPLEIMVVHLDRWCYN